MIKFTFPIDAGNDAIRSRKVEKVFNLHSPDDAPISATAAAIQI